MMFFDTLYIVCCDFYKNREKDIFKISGAILLTCVFNANIFLVLTLLSNNKKLGAITVSDLYHLRYYIVIGGMFLFFVLFYLRYFVVTNYDELKVKFDAMDERKKIISIGAAVIYIPSSFILAILFAANTYYKWW
jgi:hypothetical protein